MPFFGAASPLTKQGLFEAAAKVDADPITLWAVAPVTVVIRGNLLGRD